MTITQRYPKHRTNDNLNLQRGTQLFLNTHIRIKDPTNLPIKEYLISIVKQFKSGNLIPIHCISKNEFRFQIRLNACKAIRKKKITLQLPTLAVLVTLSLDCICLQILIFPPCTQNRSSCAGKIGERKRPGNVISTLRQRFVCYRPDP